MADISLSAAVRDSLLSLQGTTNLINRTQGRLSSGLKVSGASDNPVAYFQSKALSDRAADFTEKKAGIDQGVSTVSAALDGVTGVEAILAQMKGILQSMKSATGTNFSDLVTQFNDLRTQVDNLTTDTTYQGINLINGTGTSLDVEFSKLTASVLAIDSVDITTGTSGLDIGAITNYTGSVEVSYAAGTVGTNFGASGTANSAFAAETITLTWQGLDKAYTAGATVAFSYGTATVTATVGTAGAGTLSNGDTITVTAVSSGTGVSAFYVNVGTAQSAATTVAGTAGVSASGTYSTSWVEEGATSAISALITDLDTALDTTRSTATTLGTNVSLLQTRLDFTSRYVNSLDEGSGKLTLADINQEGANLLALQTRQQLGVNSLAFAGQAEQSILSLFR